MNSLIAVGVSVYRRHMSSTFVSSVAGLAIEESAAEQYEQSRHQRPHQIEIKTKGLLPIKLEDAALFCSLRCQLAEYGEKRLKNVINVINGLGFQFS
ncbi:MAG: hypothetical protein JEY79_07235 [Pseudodesulfovibrio sp.]|nr:hypothetical protein [Pseudodesulfovibrio sp.]